MSKRIGAAAMLLALACAAPAAAGGTPLHNALGAPENLRIRLNLRSRVEALGGQFRPGKPASDSMLSLRTTLFAEYDFGGVRLGAEIIDARAYGEDPNSSVSANEVNSLEPVQFYVAVDADGLVGAKSKAAVGLGRFVPDIGSQRLVGRVDFPDTVNAFTGAYLDWRSAANDRLFVFWGLPTTHQPSNSHGVHHNLVQLDSESMAQQFYGASFVKAGLFSRISGEAYAYRLVESDSSRLATRDRHLLTLGGRLNRAAAKGQLDFEIEGAYQSGHTRLTTAASDRADIPVSAYFVHADTGKLYPGPWAPRVSVHFDVASGDGADARSYNRFDTLYGARRVDFGPSSLYGPLGRANLVSGGLRIEAKPGVRTDGFIMYRALWLASATDSFSATGVRDRTGRSGSFAGHQIEMRLRQTLVPKRLRVEAGAAWLIKRQFLVDAPNAPDTGNTRYLYIDLVADL